MLALRFRKRTTNVPADIQHVVVLMLENRSFDCMLGRLYPDDPDYRGLTLNESNPYANAPIRVWSGDGMPPDIACTPKPDPGEKFKDINQQLFGPDGKRTQAPPNMNGFASNYAGQPASKDGPFAPRNAMHFFNPNQVPVISQLARAFGVSDDWYASAPCQTWPNRFFTHTGTARGHVDNNTFLVPFPAESIFHRLQKAGKPWRVYFHDMPQSILLGDIWLSALFHFRRFNQFLADAQTGNLPNYSFIEPRYFSDLFLNNIPNDEHPPHDVTYGEQLITQVYNAVRASPCWEKTLLIITYDEHGGCFDHVPPPTAVSPDTNVNKDYNYAFDSYGVRVPAVLISPYIKQGSKIRPPPDANGKERHFDHTSIIATVRKLFLPGDPPLTRRDAAAPDLLSSLTLAVPGNEGPPRVDPSLMQPAPADVAERAQAEPNGMQASLSAAAAALPSTPPTSATTIPAPAELPDVSFPTVAIAHANATANTNRFLGLS
jgi:phospholipase C